MAWLDPEDPDLQEDLEIACLDAIRGDPPSAALVTRLLRAVNDVLRARGCVGARVQARSDHRGTFVTIALPAPGDTVREVRLQVR